MFRTLISINLPLEQMMERASRVFCESTLPTQYATLVCGRATTSGAVEICNAGHLPPILVQHGNVTSIAATGLPVGVFCSESFSVSRFQMNKGDSLCSYTLTACRKVRDGDGLEYGADRLSQLLSENQRYRTDSIDLLVPAATPHFCGRTSFHKDDSTLMAVQRAKVNKVDLFPLLTIRDCGLE